MNRKINIEKFRVYQYEILSLACKHLDDKNNKCLKLNTQCNEKECIILNEVELKIKKEELKK